MANKPEIKKKERMVEKKKKRETNKTTTLSEKKEEQEMSASNETKVDTRNPCTRYNPFSRQQHGRVTDAHELPHTKKEWAVR